MSETPENDAERVLPRWQSQELEDALERMSSNLRIPKDKLAVIGAISLGEQRYIARDFIARGGFSVDELAEFLRIARERNDGAA